MSILDMKIEDDKFGNLINITQDENTFNVDYKRIGIEDNLIISQLNQCAKQMEFNFKKSNEHMLAFAKNLKAAQSILANAGSKTNGMFVEWFTQLGLQKNFVYRILDRYNIYLETNNIKTMEVPMKVINYFKKNDTAVKDINEVINSKKPSVSLDNFIQSKIEEPTHEEKMEKLLEELNMIEIKIKKLQLRKDEINIILGEHTK